MDIPVFHDDQHGTAIIAAAGLNALHLTDRDMAETKLVGERRGRRGIACTELLKAMGFAPNNVILCDTKGVIYRGRTEGMNQWKSAMRPRPMPLPRGRPERRGRRVRPLGQGRLHGRDDPLNGAQPDHLRHGQSGSGNHPGGSRPHPRRRDHRDRPVGLSNQVNNVLGFPLHLPRRYRRQATTINMEMKIAAAQAPPNSPARTFPTRWLRPIRVRGRAERRPAFRCPSTRVSSTRSRWRSQGPRWTRASRAGRSWTCAPTRRSSPPGAIPSPGR